jgi:broad specificity phosphatase PhoE
MNSITARPVSSQALAYFLCRQGNATASAEVLRELGGDEKLAAQVLRWSQTPEYQGKELLVARLVKAGSLAKSLPERGNAGVRDLRAAANGVATDYWNHRTTFDRLPPAGPIIKPTNPMQPVPKLTDLVAQGKKELTPAFLAQKKAEGLTYDGTVGVVMVRHGQTDQNAVPGGVAGGSILGPYGAHLLPQSRQDASNLRGIMQELANQGAVKSILVSPVERADMTYRLATQDVRGLPSARYSTDLREYKVGGAANLIKIAPEAQRFYSAAGDFLVGKNAYGGTGIDFNNRDVNKPLPTNPVLPGAERFNDSPIRTQGGLYGGESREDHFRRVQAVQLNELGGLPDGGWSLQVSHQFTIGNADAAVFTGRAAGDRMATGKGIPNTAPQYWVLHRFKDSQGNLVLVPAIAGQGDLAAPGSTRAKPH